LAVAADQVHSPTLIEKEETMEEGNILAEVFPVVSGVFIAPVVKWLENKLPSDAPIRAPMIALALAALVLWGLSAWLAPEVGRNDLIRYVLTSGTATWITKSLMK
jgi:hypothetical protein